MGDACLVVALVCIVRLFALNSSAGIYKMVENAYKVTLASAFALLLFRLYWKRANSRGAVCHRAKRVVVRLLDIFHPGGIWPSHLFGLLISLAGMLAGSLFSAYRRV